jgi:uncharacterized protein (TIRG00374 family)
LKLDRRFRSFLDTNQSRATHRNRLIFWFSVALATLLLYLALRDLDWDAFLSRLSNAQIVYLPLFALWGTLTYLIRSYRWRVLINVQGSTTILAVFMANMAGYLGNMILPARAGELVRASYLAKQNGILPSFALATGLAERLMDVIALVLLGSISILWTGLLSPALKVALQVMGLAGLIGFSMILVLPRIASTICDMIQKLPLFSHRHKEEVCMSVQSFIIGLSSLTHGRRAAGFGILTAFIWLGDAAGIVFLAKILFLSLTLLQACVLLAVLGLSSALPSTPGYIGIYQFAAAVALKPFGFSSTDAIALVLFAQIMNLVIIGIWGLGSVHYFQKRLRKRIEDE